MGTTLKEYSELAEDLIKSDEGRDNLFRKIDNVFNIEWDVPDEVAKMPWVYPVKSTDGHDALRAVQRIFSSREPSITVWPGSSDPRAMDQADELERALRWFMHQALGTGRGAPLADIVMSAARYDEVTAQLIFHPHQKKILEGHGAKVQNERRKNAIRRKVKAMEKKGPFGFVVRNPRFVHSRISEYGLEAVCHAAVWTKDSLIDYYGLSAADIIRAESAENASEYYAVFDVYDHMKHFAFASPVSNPNVELGNYDLADHESTIELVDRENKLDWINWIVEVGGTSIEVDEGNKRIPMLYSVVKADQYEIQNIIHTILLSEGVAHAAAPRGKKSGPGAEHIEMGYGDPQLDVELKPGQDYERLEPPQLDQALFQLTEWVGQNLEKSTVPSVLQGGNVPVQVFSTLNLAVQSGMITLDPYRKLVERAMNEAAQQMIDWTKEHGKPLEAVSLGRGDENQKIVQTFTLDPDNLPDEGVFIESELQEKVPIDNVSRANAAQMLRELGASKRKALEEAGESDATGLIEEAQFEDMEAFFTQRFLQQIQQQDQMNMQRQQAQLQLEMQMAATQMQQGMQMQGEEAPTGRQAPSRRPRGRRPMNRNPAQQRGSAGEGVRGRGFDPNQGGTPAEQAEPGMGQERQSGQSRGGQDTA